MNKLKPVYLVWDESAKRYLHNTTRDFGIYSSKSEEFFSREDLEKAYAHGLTDYKRIHKSDYNFNKAVDELIEHDGKPYKEC